MGKPSYDEAILAAYFMPLEPSLYDDPIVGPVLERLECEDPDLIAAVADVDRSQIRDTLARTPAERLDRAFGLAATFTSLRRAAG